MLDFETQPRYGASGDLWVKSSIRNAVINAALMRLPPPLTVAQSWLWGSQIQYLKKMGKCFDKFSAIESSLEWKFGAFAKSLECFWYFLCSQPITLQDSFTNNIYRSSWWILFVSCMLLIIKKKTSYAHFLRVWSSLP